MSTYGFDMDYHGTSLRPYRSTLMRSPTRSVTALSDKESNSGRGRRNKTRQGYAIIFEFTNLSKINVKTNQSI